MEPSPSKLTKAEKQAAFLKSLKRIRSRLTEGCGNHLCGREYCKSSKNFKYADIMKKYAGDKNSGEISKLSLKIATKQMNNPLTCEDPPFLLINWDSGKTSLLPAEDELEELKLLYLDVGQGL